MWLEEFPWNASGFWTHCWQEREDLYYCFFLQPSHHNVKIHWSLASAMAKHADGWWITQDEELPDGVLYLPWDTREQEQEHIAFYHQITVGNPNPFILERLL